MTLMELFETICIGLADVYNDDLDNDENDDDFEADENDGESEGDSDLAEEEEGEDEGVYSFHLFILNLCFSFCCCFFYPNSSLIFVPNAQHVGINFYDFIKSAINQYEDMFGSIDDPAKLLPASF